MALFEGLLRKKHAILSACWVGWSAPTSLCQFSIFSLKFNVLQKISRGYPASTRQSGRKHRMSRFAKMNEFWRFLPRQFARKSPISRHSARMVAFGSSTGTRAALRYSATARSQATSARTRIVSRPSFPRIVKARATYELVHKRICRQDFQRHERNVRSRRIAAPYMRSRPRARNRGSNDRL